MRALLIDEVTPAESARLSEIPVPEVRPGWVLVRVRGFGLNHSEQVLRHLEIRSDYITRPIVPGIEGVGEVAGAGDADLAVGTRVCMLMGGMGRMWNGSYAQYCLVPRSHLFVLPEVACHLPWATLAAIPETFYTAWGSLFEGLRLEAGETLLVRGASCALGFAAIQLAHALGCRIIATTHRQAHVDSVRAMGADEVIVDGTGALAPTGIRAHKVLELIGPKTLRDSLLCLHPGGICCDTGILGGVFALDRFDPIKDVPNGRYLTGFFSNYPTQLLMDEVFTFVVTHHIEPCIARTFSFEHLPDALAMQDAGGFEGKIVVTCEEEDL